MYYDNHNHPVIVIAINVFVFHPWISFTRVFNWWAFRGQRPHRRDALATPSRPADALSGFRCSAIDKNMLRFNTKAIRVIYDNHSQSSRCPPSSRWSSAVPAPWPASQPSRGCACRRRCWSPVYNRFAAIYRCRTLPTMQVCVVMCPYFAYICDVGRRQLLLLRIVGNALQIGDAAIMPGRLLNGRLGLVVGVLFVAGAVRHVRVFLLGHFAAVLCVRRGCFSRLCLNLNICQGCCCCSIRVCNDITYSRYAWGWQRNRVNLKTKRQFVTGLCLCFDSSSACA